MTHMSIEVITPRRGRPKFVQDIAVASDPDALLTVETVSALTSYRPSVVRKLANSGRLPAPVRVGRLVRWRAGEIRAWLQGQGAPASPTLQA
jgi:predicted DNA-binding transcriptional regulator AlpA